MEKRMTKWEAQHRRDLAALEKQIQKIYEEAVREAASLSALVPFNSTNKPFLFKDYPITHQRIEKLLAGLKSDLTAAIVNGVESEWTLANNKNNELCNQVFGDNVGRLTEEQYQRYYSSNPAAMQAFIDRKDMGLNLSDKVWRYTAQFKEEIELGIDIGLRDGLSADEMSRQLRQYLRYPDKLFRRVRDEHGILRLSQAARAFHPGRGVYRSSYKNARRLAATECNIAYRTADFDRWQRMDFVVGIEVRLSNNHTLNGVPFTDLCDDLKGKYPKDFKFTGWHPLCRCYSVSILKTREELFADNQRILNEERVTKTSSQAVRRPPKRFKEWMDENEERALRGKTLPYFMTDNIGYMPTSIVGRIDTTQVKELMRRAQLSGDGVQGLALGIANRHGAVVTPINFKGEDSIRRKTLLEREGGDISFSALRLKDSVRTTIIAPREGIEAILKDLQQAEAFYRIKIQSGDKFIGYSGNIINIKTGNGILAEVQVNTPRMIYAKEKPDIAKSIIGEKRWNEIRRETGLEGGLGHEYYEEYRLLNPNSPRAKEIARLSEEYYSHFRR